MKPILQIVFPEGNCWFYVISGFWFLAITIFFMSLPILLASTGYWYEHETGEEVDMDSELSDLSEFLYGAAFEMWRIYSLFLAVSCMFDMYSIYLKWRKEAGYL